MNKLATPPLSGSERGRKALIGVAVLFIQFFAGPVFADYSVDTAGTTGGNTGWGNLVTQRIAQSFTTVGVGVVTSVDTFQLINTGSGANYYLTLEADSSGQPSGTPLVTSASVSNLNSCSSVQNVTFFGAPSLSASTLYWIVFHTNSLSALNDNQGCGNTDTYGGGTQLRDQSGWSDQSIDEKMVVYIQEGGSGEATTTIATSTPEEVRAAVAILYVAVGAFFIGLVGTIWIYSLVV